MAALVKPAPTRKRKLPSDSRGLRNREGTWAAKLILPTIVLLAAVIIYPIVSAIVMSFQQDAGLDSSTGMFSEGGEFAGLSNYAHWIFQQCPGPGETTLPCPPGTLGSQFWSATGNTFFLAIVTVVMDTIIGFWMAVIMSRTFRGRGIVRAAILVPWAVPTVVSAKLWFFIFAYQGIFNALFNLDVLWTGSHWPSMFAILIVDIWKTAPFSALLILAGLQLIPEEVYEAAKVDGATTWQRFIHITLPLLRPAIMVSVLFRMLDALRLFDTPYILTGGANNTSTLSTLVVDQIRQGFSGAAALSTITFLIIFIVAFIFVRFLGANAVASATSDGKVKASE